MVWLAAVSVCEIRWRIIARRQSTGDTDRLLGQTRRLPLAIFTDRAHVQEVVSVGCFHDLLKQVLELVP